MVQGSKTQKIILDGHGSFLGMEKGCFTVRDRGGNVKRFPLFDSEIGEMQLKSGNMVSTGALASCGFWGIDCLFLTQRGRPVAMLLRDERQSWRPRITHAQIHNSGISAVSSLKE